jgi:hypothetical protein
MKTVQTIIIILFFLFCKHSIKAQVDNINKKIVQIGIDGASTSQDNRSFLYRGNNNTPSADSSNRYSGRYNLSASFGKFRTNYSSIIWTLGLGISKNESYNYSESNSSGLSLSLERTNEYYKNVVGKLGIYGNFRVRLNYNNETSNYTTPKYTSNSSYATNLVGLGISGGVGLYYSFTNKWTLTANLMSINGLYLNYQWFNRQSDIPLDDYQQTVSRFEYQFFPSINLTSGLNLRYIF